MAGLQNCSLTTLDIKVVSNKGDEKVRSFGLGATAKERVMVEKKPFVVVEQWKSNHKTECKYCGG